MPDTAFVITLVAISLQLQLLRAQISAPAPAPGAMAMAPSLDCTGGLLNLTSCLTYVASGSSLTRPDKGCCGALAGVVSGEAACLCGLVGGYRAYGVRVDAVRALALPTICRVDAPPPSLCAALGVPVAEPPGGAVTAEPGPGMPTITPSTTAANGGPAMCQHPRLRHMVALPCCLVLLTLLF